MNNVLSPHAVEELQLMGVAVLPNLKLTKNSKVPNDNELRGNFPNPFNPSTNISFYLENSGHVNVVIYDILGNKVRTLVHDNKPSGRHTVLWDGSNDQGLKVSSGMYIYVLQMNGQIVSTKRMLMIK